MQLAKSPPFRLGTRLSLFIFYYFFFFCLRKKSPNWKSLRRAANLFLSLSVPFQCKSLDERVFLVSLSLSLCVPSIRRIWRLSPSLFPFSLGSNQYSSLICLARVWLSRKRNSAISRAVKRANSRWPSHVSKQGVKSLRLTYATITHGWMDNQFLLGQNRGKNRRPIR